MTEREMFEQWVSASGRAHMLARDARHGWYIDLNVTAWFAGWMGRAALQQAKQEPDMILMPRRLTAENGAKAALSGEFAESIIVKCPECGDDEDHSCCDVCDADGEVIQHVPVSWTTIKAIYGKAVELFAATVQQTKNEPVAYGLFWKSAGAERLQFPVAATKEECEESLRHYSKSDREMMIIRPLHALPLLGQQEAQQEGDAQDAAEG